MSKILITGGAGFVGFSLARRLSDAGDHRLVVLDNLSRGRMDPELRELIGRSNVDFVEGDATDAEVYAALDTDFDYIYHLAAVIGVKNVMERPDRVLYVNAISVLRVLEYARSVPGLKKLLFSSTSEAYAGTQKHFGIDVPTAEDVPLALDDVSSARTTYALSKIFGESACFTWANRYGVPVTIVRYHNVYGPRMGFAHVIPETFVKVTENPRVDVPSPGHTRAFCYIDDALEYTVRACESSETAGEILNVGNATEEVRIVDLVSLIADVVGRQVDINEQPDTPGSPPRRCPATAKIVSLTGYEPQYDLRSGVERTWDWYRERLTERFE